jgi:Protein of unknown function (DUF998)
MNAAAGMVSLIALAAVVVSLTYLHIAPTALSPVHNAVSQYGITKFRAGYRAATIAFAVSGLALAVGLAGTIRDHGRSQVVGLLLVFAAARAAISWFPMDAPGAERTPTGREHGWLAVAAFGGATLAALRLANVLSRADVWHALAPLSAGLGWLMAAVLLLLAATRYVRAVRAWFGAIERVFYGAAIAWFAVFGYACAASVR